ncbi:MAG: hypothetical protein MK008_11420 [Bdellovibrionales bacterium]|nr:hypothetical protein [Bdellovibrionales bacterium]
MLKILLALDDYQEQTFLHRLLTKMGFNLEVTQTDQAIGGLIMGFQPQVVLVAEKSRKINSTKLIKDIKSKRASTQFILIKHSTSKDNQDIENEVQFIVNSPVHPEELFTALSDVSHLQKQDLLNKYNKLSSSIKSSKKSSEESQYIQGSSVKDKSDSKSRQAPKTSINESDRQKKYDQFLESVDKVNTNETTFERKKIKEFNKELRSQSEFHESPELKIDKFQYTKNLLKKNK